MAYEKLILLAPCHGLEDFPLYHTGEDAASLLACWTALWHPLLLRDAKGLPQVQRCDYPPEDLSESLLLLPLLPLLPAPRVSLFWPRPLEVFPGLDSRCCS